MRKTKNYGFTLIELLVAVTLSLIVISATVSIFITSSTIMSSSERRIAIFQNARAALQTLSDDMLNASTSEGFPFTMQNPNSGNNHTLMKFSTITTWLEPVAGSTPNIVQGEARAYYYLEKQGGRWSLKRHLVRDDIDTEPSPVGDETFVDTLSDDVICQFINEGADGIPDVNIDFFFYSDPDPDNGTTDDMVIQVNNPAGQHIFLSNPNLENEKLPIAIRLTASVTDDKRREVRTISRMFWLSNAEIE